MADEEYIYFKCLEMQQPIGSFYLGAIPFAQVTFIAYADVRRIEARDVERYIGIQRPLENSRVKELKGYVTNIDASFPTSVILAVEGKNARFDPESGVMRLTKNIEVAKIIDGQHRIAGLLNYNGPNFQLNVTIFVDMDIEDQAHLFATINLKQTKVNKSLAYDLFEFAKMRSPQKTCHTIAKVLDTKEGSPLYHRIKILGRATGRGLENITQAAVVERLIKYISTNPMKDRDDIRRHISLNRAVRSEQVEKKLFFRNMFIDDHDDDILLVVWNFFAAVAGRWPGAWNTDMPGMILNKSTGFTALVRLMADIYLDIDKIGTVPSIEKYREYLDQSKTKDEFFVKENFLPGTSGESGLYNFLATELGLQ